MVTINDSLYYISRIALDHSCRRQHLGCGFTDKGQRRSYWRLQEARITFTWGDRQGVTSIALRFSLNLKEEEEEKEKKEKKPGGWPKPPFPAKALVA